MKDLTKLEERFSRFDELERSGGTVDVAEPTKDSTQMTIITAPPPAPPFDINAAESIKSNPAETKSLPNTLGIDWNIDVSDAYIEDKIERMSKVGERLNKLTKKSASKTDGGEISVDYPIIGRRGGSGDYTLAADYLYHADAGYRITAPRGFQTDLSSVPRILWVLISPDELSLSAPIIHDLLYRSGGVLEKAQVVKYRHFTRAEADLLFLEIMKSEGISSWRCKAGYLAVSKFGSGSWQPNR